MTPSPEAIRSTAPPAAVPCSPPLHAAPLTRPTNRRGTGPPRPTGRPPARTEVEPSTHNAGPPSVPATAVRGNAGPFSQIAKEAAGQPSHRSYQPAVAPPQPNVLPTPEWAEVQTGSTANGQRDRHNGGKGPFVHLGLNHGDAVGISYPRLRQDRRCSPNADRRAARFHRATSAQFELRGR